jgi:hypothetical protein
LQILALENQRPQTTQGRWQGVKRGISQPMLHKQGL